MPYIGWISLTYTGNHYNAGALVGCSATSGTCASSWTSGGAPKLLSYPTAIHH